MILGGTSYVYKKEMGLEVRSEKKVNLGKLLICETDEDFTLQEYLKETQCEQKSTQESEKSSLNCSIEESMLSNQTSKDFLDWNPHLFPHETNKTKIEYLQSQIEEEESKTRKRSSILHKYAGFEGLEEENSFVPIILPKPVPISKFCVDKEEANFCFRGGISKRNSR